MANNVWDIKSDLIVEYLVSGTWTAIQADTYEVSIDRGINVEQGVFCRPDVGNVTVRLTKKGLTDLVTGPAYKANMPLQIRYRPNPDTSPTVWENIFFGYISNVAIQYDDQAKKLKIEINAYDMTKILMNTRLTSFEIKSGVHSFKQIMTELESKIYAIDSRFILSQDGTTGSSTFQDYETYADVLSGEIVNQSLDAELGWVFADKDTEAQYYMTRSDVAAKRNTAWSTSNVTVSNIHSTSTNHVCMDYIDLVWDTDGLVNSCWVEHALTKINTTKKNTTSITNYGEWPANFSIQMDTGSSPYTRLQNWAQAVVDAADPKRIQSVSCPALRRDGTTSKIVTKDIGDPLQVEFVDPSNTANKIQQVAIITRIQHQIDADHWEMTIGLWKGI